MTRDELISTSRLERDPPELRTFFDFPRPLWRKLRTTNAIERCLVEVRRRTRPMVVFTNVQSVERIKSACGTTASRRRCLDASARAGVSCAP
jgi:transposase-like protein